MLREVLKGGVCALEMISEGKGKQHVSKCRVHRQTDPRVSLPEERAALGKTGEEAGTLAG